MSTTTNLEVLRIDRGYSLQQLGDELNCSGNCIWRWEHGLNRATPAYGKRLRDFFGVPVSVLLAPAPNDKEAASAKLTTS